jgi:hypothetical protein
MASQTSRRQQALVLAEELLGEIELGQLRPPDVARKASRLARLLDDVDAMQWLRYETGGYPPSLDADAFNAALRSNRRAEAEDPSEGPKVWTPSLAELDTQVQVGEARLAAEVPPSGGGQWELRVATDSAARRGVIAKHISESAGIRERIVGAIHEYVAAKYQELRFGSAVEGAFEVVRGEVDGRIGEVVPNALPMITAAFENAASDNPEHWANAASTSRRLLKAVADHLRPAGPDVTTGDGRTVKMGEGNYLNRLGDWVRSQTDSETQVAVFEAEVQYLDAQLRAADKAGQKGAHDAVTQLEASRFVAGTYLILGDILRLADRDTAAAPAAHETAQPGEAVAEGVTLGDPASSRPAAS